MIYSFLWQCKGADQPYPILIIKFIYNPIHFTCKDLLISRFLITIIFPTIITIMNFMQGFIYITGQKNW